MKRVDLLVALECGWRVALAQDAEDVLGTINVLVIMSKYDRYGRRL